jgi:hypothetical protein
VVQSLDCEWDGRGFVADEILPATLWPWGPTQPLTGATGHLARTVDILTTNCKVIIYIMWEAGRLRTLWASTACNTESFSY